ncbi:unnamed protein product, partial [Coregonus sp. 'balchen']
IDLPIILVLLNIELSIACGRAEYRIVDECCPMCSPGNRVHKHCTEFTSTSCVPCSDSTFLDEPNGLTACIQCTNCDPGFGLKVKQPCRPSSDTVCGTLEGFYCLDPTKDDGSLTSCQPHTECEFLEIEAGTPWSDSECGVTSLPTAGTIAGIIAGVLICFLIDTIAGVCLFIVRKREMIQASITVSDSTFCNLWSTGWLVQPSI